MLLEVVHLTFCLVILVKTDSHVLTFTCSLATTIGGSHSSGSMWPVSVNLKLANSSVPPLKQKGWA